MLGLSWSLNRAPQQIQQFPTASLTNRQQAQQKIDKEYAGAKNTGGLTWPGSQFTGPGNRLVDENNKSNFTELPKTDLDWVTMEHDVDYFNAANPTKDKVWEMDKKAIKAAWDVNDPYYGAAATIVGLVAKNIAERTDEAITGDPFAIYPQSKKSSYEIPWFKPRPQIRKKELREYHASSLSRSPSTTKA
ncbi:putative structural protein [Dysaphis plantaginea densovirus]|uniref:Structural protein n=1 Tax=Dysaphis plantaginea densovirus 1 TaxID=3070906 RepID=B5TYJ0_9VIRU|nr:putative structural protein [Dysaphis plantaginea densovirus]ACI01076.1 putative structural protein [Dysaphis plantaginea densovirus]